MIAQDAQNLDIAEERRQFEPTKAIAVSAIQARVGADPQLVTTNRQQTIDLSVGQSCVHLGSSPAPKKKEAIAECAHPNLAVGCFCQRDYCRLSGSQFLNVVWPETELSLLCFRNHTSVLLVF